MSTDYKVVDVRLPRVVCDDDDLMTRDWRRSLCSQDSVGSIVYSQVDHAFATVQVAGHAVTGLLAHHKPVMRVTMMLDCGPGVRLVRRAVDELVMTSEDHMTRCAAWRRDGGTTKNIR